MPMAVIVAVAVILVMAVAVAVAMGAAVGPALRLEGGRGAVHLQGAVAEQVGQHRIVQQPQLPGRISSATWRLPR